MAIVVQCPHCETKFNLQPEMAGKAMRCPNLDCRKVFTPKIGGRPTEPPPPLPPDPEEMRKPAVPTKPRAPEKPDRAAKPAKPAKPPVVEAEVVEAAVVAPPKVKEVVWSEDADVPPPPKPKKPLKAAAAEEPEDDAPRVPIARRKKKKERGPWLLIGMCVAVVGLIGFAALYILKFQGDTEAALAKQAEDEYKKPDYPAAQKSYEKLLAEYPEGENAPKYKFFAELSALQVSSRTATNRENPDEAVKKLRAFIDTHKSSDFAKSSGHDITEAAKKVMEDLVEHAKARVKAYQDDRTKSGEIERAKKTIATGRELIPLLNPLRAQEDLPYDLFSKGFDAVEADIKKERDRLEALSKASTQLQTVSDVMIQMVEAELTSAGLIADPEAQAMLAAAKGTLREMVKFEADKTPIEPRAVPTNAAASILFVAPIGPTRRPIATSVDDGLAPSVFLAVARGILYALEEESGSLLWATRVGPEITEPPTVAKVNLDGGPTDVALVTSTVGGVSALSWYVVKTGEARWYQPLPAPAAGPAAIFGSRVFVAVRDPEGSIYEFDLTSGVRKGRIRLGQAAGPGIAVRPGTGLLYAVADARRIYVIDAGAKDFDGAMKPPVCVQVLATGHAAGTLRTLPIFLGPEGDEPADRWMILTQADGPTTTKVRVFSMIPIQPLTDGKVPDETAVRTVDKGEIAVPGWVWFPPATDGERLALATDAGQFRLFGVNQPGNLDRALFPLAAPSLPAPPEGIAVPGVILPAEEAAFWVIANGVMQKYRVALQASRGLDVIPTGPRSLIGIPTQPPQLNNRRNSACLVVRSANSAGSRAVVVNLADGEIRWQRQLGLVAGVSPIPHEGSVILAAEDGGMIALPGAGAAVPGRITVSPPAWLLADSPENATGPTVVAVSPDGKTIFTVTPVIVIEDQKPLSKWMVRRIVGGQVTHRGAAASPGAIAGTPVLLGDSLLIPCADGFVYRHVPGTGRANPDSMTAGPQWASDRRPDAVCFITVTSDTSFLTNDGGKKLNPWNWPKSANSSAGAGAWQLDERPAGPGVILPPAAPGEPARMLVNDVAGSVWLYAADRPGPPARRWRPGGGLPAGKPTSTFIVQPDSANRPMVAYTVDNKFLVCLDLTRAEPRWVAKVGDEADHVLVGTPQPAGGGQWLVSDLGGHVTMFDAEGVKVNSLAIGLPGAVPSVSAGAVGGGSVLAPLSDGSAVVLTFPVVPKVEPAPDPKSKE